MKTQITTRMLLILFGIVLMLVGGGVTAQPPQGQSQGQPQSPPPVMSEVPPPNMMPPGMEQQSQQQQQMSQQQGAIGNGTNNVQNNASSDRRPRGMGGRGFGGRGGLRISPEQMEAFRNMTPEQRMDAFRKMHAERDNAATPKATPNPALDATMVKSLMQSEEFSDLNDDAALAWRRLTNEQRLELASMTPEERESFRHELTGFILAADKASTETKERMAGFLTEKQLYAIRALTEKQHTQATQIIEGYTSISLVEKSLAGLPESDRAALKRMLPAEKRAFLASKGYDTSLIDSLFPRLVAAEPQTTSAAAQSSPTNN
ncbi:MAG: hypothetical protein PHX74_01440 [Candidatus Sumerlaeales bacterium]|nr:hypothetical protein [Candidatus Sumerlaeales bacterium]